MLRATAGLCVDAAKNAIKKEYRQTKIHLQWKKHSKTRQRFERSPP